MGGKGAYGGNSNKKVLQSLSKFFGKRRDKKPGKEKAKVCPGERETLNEDICPGRNGFRCWQKRPGGGRKGGMRLGDRLSMRKEWTLTAR